MALVVASGEQHQHLPGDTQVHILVLVEHHTLVRVEHVACMLSLQLHCIYLLLRRWAFLQEELQPVLVAFPVCCTAGEPLQDNLV